MIRGGRFYLGHNADRRTLELNGHTLTLNLPTGMVFERNLKAVGGRIAVTAGEIQPESGTDFTEVGVDFSGDAIVFLAYDLIVKDFSYSAARWGSHANATQVYVGGVYTAGANRPPVTLKDGATLDLSAQTGVWSADGQAATSGANDRYISGTGLVSFADGATIKVDLGERPLTSGLQLVKWTNKPTNVRFRPSAGANCGFVVNGNGLYVSKGLMIFIQ